MELKFECPTCGQHISATPAQIGVTAPCPNCNTAVTVPNLSTLPPSLPPLPQPQSPLAANTATARKRRKSEFLGKGALVQLLAIALFFVVAPFAGGLVAFILALILFVIGSSMSSSWICGACGNKLSDKNVKVCPTCRSTFTK
jgi:rubrerythrin